MNEENKKYLGESKIVGQPDKKLTIKIKDGAITTDKLAEQAITPEKVSPRVFNELVKPTTDDLQNQIDSLEVAGVAVSNNFGSNTHISISQKRLTDAFNTMWEKVGEIAGEDLAVIDIEAVPSYFISEGSQIVKISITNDATSGIFDEITFYVNGEIGTDVDGNKTQAFNTNHYECEIELTDTSEIGCSVKLFGIDYYGSTIIYKYNNFFVGPGKHYTDVMTREYAYDISKGMAGDYAIDTKDDDNIFIVMVKTFRDSFDRADMNGFEIPFNETTTDDYVVLTSKNTYKSGNYSIYINR